MFYVTGAAFCGHDDVSYRGLSWHVQWIRDVVHVLWYFFRGGGSTCEMRMDLTHAFCVGGAMNSCRLALHVLFFFVSGAAFCDVC